MSRESCQTVDTDKSAETVPTSPDLSADVAPETECGTQPPAIPEIALTEPSEISPEDTADIMSALQPESGIPTTESLPPFAALYDYSAPKFTQEDFDDLWIMTILQRPGYATEYARLNCGFWYILEDKKNVRIMVVHEYEEFVQWISEANAVGTAAMHNNEPDNNEPDNDEPNNNEPDVDKNDRPKHLNTKWTPKPAD